MKAYVLAGGRSRRMGERKDRLSIGGESFLDRVVRAASEAFDEAVIVTRPELPIRHDLARVVVETSHEETSPLFGMRAGLVDGSPDPVWILGVDYPLISVPLLAFLRDRFESSECDLLVPMWDGRPQMLCAGLSQNVAMAVQRKLESHDLRLRGLLDTVRSLVVDESELRARFPGEPLRNVNTPEDLARIRDLPTPAK